MGKLTVSKKRKMSTSDSTTNKIDDTIDEHEHTDDRKKKNTVQDVAVGDHDVDETDDHNDASNSIHDDDNDEAEAEAENMADDSDNEDNDGTTNISVPPATRIETSDGKYRNKQRCLTLCSRNVTARYRHLLEDLRTLIPHHKKESKLDNGTDDNLGSAVQLIAEIRGCNTVLFLECRKRQDAYLWLGRTGFQAGGGSNNIASATSSSCGGPSAKFYVTNIHTMDELKLTGNCMKSSRPILSFDESFNRLGHLKLLKELFTDVFTTPRGHPKSKPFIDRIMSFYYADNRIWVRNYQIVEQKPETSAEAHRLKKQLGVAESTSLVEIGPRFVLEPIRIFRGSFGGQTLYSNTKFTSPNAIRAAEKQKAGSTFAQRQATQKLRKDREDAIIVPTDPLESVFK